jgi:hypothetical protein
MKKVYFCEDCGCEMTYTGDLTEAEYEKLASTDNLDWTCPKCGADGWLSWCEETKESVVILARERTYEEIYTDPDANTPACCIACGGPYPDCLTSCKIFDD